MMIEIIDIISVQHILIHTINFIFKLKIYLKCTKHTKELLQLQNIKGLYH